METTTETIRDLTLLEQIEENPDVTQANLAEQLGVAVGTVNWHLKRLVSKGYVKVQRAQRRKLIYLITPKGITLRARLTVEYVERNFMLYRKTRERVTALLEQVRVSGYSTVRIDALEQGPEDVLDVCKLTCLEQGIQIVTDKEGTPTPILRISGVHVSLEIPQEVSL